jgi:hypothetical protein
VSGGATLASFNGVRADAPTACPRTADDPRAEPAARIWQRPPRLTPELIAAYKRQGDRLRTEAFAAVIRRSLAWLARRGG